MGISEIVRAITAPMARRVRLLARRAIVRLVYDGPKMQELQLAIMAGEVRDRVERWEDYGLTSHPRASAEALVLALGGNTGHSAVIRVADRRYRLRGLAEGEVALYDDQSQVVHLKRDRIIHIYGCNVVRVEAAEKVRYETPLMEVTGEIIDRCDSGGRSMSQMRQVYDDHDHPETDNGGPTGPPNQTME